MASYAIHSGVASSLQPATAAAANPQSQARRAGESVAWPPGLSSSKTMEFAKNAFAKHLKTHFPPEIVDLGNSRIRAAIDARKAGNNDVRKFSGTAKEASELIKYQNMHAHVIEVLHFYQKIEQLLQGPPLSEKLKGIQQTDAEALVWIVVTAHPTLFSHPEFSQLTINILDTLTDMRRSEMAKSSLAKPSSRMPSLSSGFAFKDGNDKRVNSLIKDFIETAPIRSKIPSVDEEHDTFTIGDDVHREGGGFKIRNSGLQKFVARMGTALHQDSLIKAGKGERMAGKPVELSTRFDVIQTATLDVNHSLPPGISQNAIKFNVWAGGRDHDGHNVNRDNIRRASVKLLTKQFSQYEETLSEASKNLSKTKQPFVDMQSVQHLITGFDQLHADTASKPLIDRLGLSRKELENPACRALAYVRIRMGAVVDQIPPFSMQPHDNPYDGIEAMQGDVECLKNALADGQALNRALLAMHSFEGYYMKGDLRQNSSVFGAVAGEILKDRLGGKEYAKLAEMEKREALVAALKDPEGLKLDEEKLTQKSAEEIAIIRAGLDMNKIFKGAVSCQIIADHEQVSHFFEAALAIAAAGGHTLVKDTETGDVTAKLDIPVVPLFEPIEHVKNSHRVVDEILTTMDKAGITMDAGMRIMFARSDSNKDGGIFCAEYEVYKAKKRLVDVAARHGIEIAYIFDGGGGSVARGGGNVMEKIATDVPAGDTMRRTFQGEQIVGDTSSSLLFAHHLADMLVANNERRENNDPEPEYFTLVKDFISDASREGYLDKWRTNPVAQIVVLALGRQLKVADTFPGSRKNVRPQDGAVLTDEKQFMNMRAIGNNVATAFPRMPIQSFFGLGTGIEEAKKDRKLRNRLLADPDVQALLGDKLNDETVVMDILKEMYKKDGFTKTLFDAIGMALASAHSGIAKAHIDLVEDLDAKQKQALFKVFADEFESTRKNLLEITGQKKLLENLERNNPKEYQIVRSRFAEADALNEMLLAMQTLAKDDAAVPIATSGIATALPFYSA